MHCNLLRQLDRAEKTIFLTNRIIVKALESDRGDIIRAMNVSVLQKMVKSVFNAVHNIIAEEARRASNFETLYAMVDGHLVIDHASRLKLMSDVEIEEEVTALFEINGKLQYREVVGESFVVFPGIDESLEYVMQQIKMGVHGMRYNPYSVEDRLERADTLTKVS